MSLFTYCAVFFNIVQNAFDPPFDLNSSWLINYFEHLVDFFVDGLGATLHCSKIGQNKAYLYVLYMSIRGKVFREFLPTLFLQTSFNTYYKH